MKKLVLVFTIMFISVGLFAQTDESQQIFSKGLKCWENADYITAKKLMKQVVSMASSTPGLREEAQEIINRCNDKMIDVHVSKSTATLEISEASLQFSSTGDFKELTVFSNIKWEVIAKPEWCEIVEKGARYLKIRSDENKEAKIKPGQIVIKAGSMTREVFVYQDAAEVAHGRVFFRVSPNNSHVEVEDGTHFYSCTPKVFNQGVHNVKISKDGYESKDTVIVIDQLDQSVRNIDISLKPLFGKIHPVFKDEEGNILTNVDFSIGKKTIDLDDYANSHSYDDRKEIIYNELYKDGMIPLNPGVYEVQASAPGYEKVVSRVIINRGDVIEFEHTMQSIMGYLVVEDLRNADGAKVSIPDLGILADIGEPVRLPIGKHQVEILKDDYLLDVGVLDVEIFKEKTTTVGAKMTRMVELLVSTQQGEESLFVNGLPVRYQEPYHRVELTEGEDYEIDIRKKGYWHVYRKLEITKNDSIIDMRNLKLQPVDTIKIKANVPDLMITLKKKDDPEVDYGEEKRIPKTKGEYTSLAIPYGKYRLKLLNTTESRRCKQVYYSGIVNFTPDKKSFKVQTWLRTGLSGMKFIGITGYAFDGGISEGLDSHLPPVGNINLFEFPIVKGLSTSLLKGSIFDSRSMEFPFGISDIASKTSHVHTGITCMLLNYDFRIAGYSFRQGDINALVSYSYYTALTNLKGFGWTHFSVHDLFVVLEAVSRIKVLNASIRMCIQYLNGSRNYYLFQFNDTDTKAHYESYDVNRLSFVIGCNICLGTGSSRGYNIWRLY